MHQRVNELVKFGIADEVIVGKIIWRKKTKPPSSVTRLICATDESTRKY